MKIIQHYYSQFRDGEIHRVQLTHALRAMALSFVGVYIPIYLLHLGYMLVDVIYFHIVFHVFGLFFGYAVILPLMRHWGMLKVFRLYFPLEVAFLFLLNFFTSLEISYLWIAIIGGSATFAYWMPLNILFLKASREDKMGSDVALLFALPKMFGIAGPLLSAVLIPIYGFLPMFIVATVGLALAFLPLIGIGDRKLERRMTLCDSWVDFKRRKKLFFLEMFDNVVEEAEWFWKIFVFLLIGSLSAPGIVGALGSLGGFLFSITVGKYVDRYDNRLVVVATGLVALLWGVRFFVDDPFWAYTTTLVASFAMSFFLISYFSVIYRSVKGDNDEEFLVLREIPTVVGRLIVFGGVLFFISEPRLFFFVPVGVLGILLLFLWRMKEENSSIQKESML